VPGRNGIWKQIRTSFYYSNNFMKSEETWRPVIVTWGVCAPERDEVTGDRRLERMPQYGASLVQILLGQ
jgi:hypothetical protein